MDFSVDVNKALNFYNQIHSSITDIVNKTQLLVKKTERVRKFTLFDYATFIIFNKGKSLETEIGNYLKNFKLREVKGLSKQAFSKRREEIDPLTFIEINTQYLTNIGYYKDMDKFKTFKGYRLIAIDKSDFEIPNTLEMRKEFKVSNTEARTNPAQTSFSSAFDVCNEFILDGILGNYKEHDLNFAHQHINNLKNLLDFNHTIFIFDRGYVSLELYSRLILNNTWFVSRLKQDDYEKDMKNMTSNDEFVDIRVLGRRLKNFKDKDLKNKIKDEQSLNLRIVKIPLVKDGETIEEIIITNLPQDQFTLEEISKIYKLRWKIETSFDTNKNKLEVEGYTGLRRFTVEQDIYSKFILYNIVKYVQNYLTLMINKFKRNKGIKKEYKANESNIIGRVVPDVGEMIINPTKENIHYLMNYILFYGSKDSLIVKKGRQYPITTPQIRKFQTNKKPLL